jgi:hypothetical protein
MTHQASNESLVHALSNTGMKKHINDFSAREFILRYIYLIPWILVCVGISLGIAHLRLRYINPVFNASGKVLIKTDRPAGTTGSDKLVGDVVATTVNVRTMDDQIELIKSTAMLTCSSRIITKAVSATGSSTIQRALFTCASYHSKILRMAFPWG